MGNELLIRPTNGDLGQANCWNFLETFEEFLIEGLYSSIFLPLLNRYFERFWGTRDISSGLEYEARKRIGGIKMASTILRRSHSGWWGADRWVMRAWSSERQPGAETEEKGGIEKERERTERISVNRQIERRRGNRRHCLISGWRRQHTRQHAWPDTLYTCDNRLFIWNRWWIDVTDVWIVLARKSIDLQL